MNQKVNIALDAKNVTEELIECGEEFETENETKNSISLVFEGKPIAKKRHQMNKKRAFDTQQAEKLKAKWSAAAQMRDKRFKMLSDAPIEVEVGIHTTIPKSFSRKHQNALEGKPTTTTPDLDNYLKWIFDILSGIAYSDDCYITKIFCEKRYSSKPRVEIILKNY